MPNALTSAGLEDAIADLVRMVNSSGEITISLEIQHLPTYSEGYSISIYRIIQEVFNNILKYAEATAVSLKIWTADFAHIEIKDNGRGFDTSMIDQSEGIGWKNIQSRLSLMGGDVSIESIYGEGTTIQLTIPIYESDQITTG